MVDVLQSERKIITDILKGKVDSFEELIHHYQKLVFSIVMRFTHNNYDREEVCQEIFIKIYQNLSGFQFKSKLSTWICKIAYNHCVNYIKKNAKYVNSDLIDNIETNENFDSSVNYISTSIENNIEENEVISLINENISQLPKLYQTIISLYHLQEMSYAEISEILELPEGTVKSYLFRSRKLLKEKLLSSYKEEELI